MNKPIFTFLILILLGITVGYAQKRSVRGMVIDIDTKESLPGAYIMVKGTSNGTISDFDGSFVLDNLDPAKYEITVSFVSYQPTDLSVDLTAGNSVDNKVELGKATTEIKEINVTAVKRSDTEVSTITAIKSSNVVIAGISSQQIAKTQDRDASEVVKRIPGITIIDDRFIVVRGLNQRYNSVWLNNSATPSSETDAKAFSFDVIPSGLIDNLMVVKSFSPEYPGDFAGGFINIFTKHMPDSNFVSIDYSTSYREGTTFKDFYMYEGGKYDWLGFDDGTRALPDEFPSKLTSNNTTPEQNDMLNHKLNKNWEAKKKTALPDQRIGITIGKRFNRKKLLIGSLTAINYSNARDIDDALTSNFYSFDPIASDAKIRFNYNDKVYTNNIKASVLHNWSFVYGNGNKLEFRNLFNQIAFNKYTGRQGYKEYWQSNITGQEFRFMSRTTYSGQLSGTHLFRERKSTLTWHAGYSYASRKEPDRKVLLKKEDLNAGNYLFNIPNLVNPEVAGRIYLDNHENIFSGSVNVDNKFSFMGIVPSLKLGLYNEYKSRQFDARNIGYEGGSNYDPLNVSLLSLSPKEFFTDENLTYTNVRLGETTDKSDSYTATNFLMAGYFSINIPINKYIGFFGGIRLEENVMELSSFVKGSTTDEVHAGDTSLAVLPSMNVYINVNEKNVIRLGYGLSINRPEFREIAPYSFYDFNESAGYSGNPDLKNAKVMNADFRYEYYPSAGETFSAAIFYKTFQNPIELVYNETGSGLDYTFRNAKKATNMGAEIELRKSLAFISLSDFSMVLNASYIQSEVKFETGSAENDRPLWGQSPYIINTGIFYQNNKAGLMISMLYNIVGKRIVVVGQQKELEHESYPDIYELPRGLLDFSFSKRFGNFELKGGIKDILDAPVKYTQTFKYTPSSGPKISMEKTLKEYNPGRIVTLGVSYRF